MRSFLITAAAASLLAASAFAQNAPGYNPANTAPAVPTARTTAPTIAANAPPAANSPSNPAVKTSEGNNSNTPVAGANSFTEGQAKARIESRGYSNVSGLAKDNNGVWRGKAQKDGKPVTVSLDFQGNVVVN